MNKDNQYTASLINELQSESEALSDRAVAILLAAELNILLFKIIQKRLVRHDKKISDQDLLLSGALGSFAARIDIAYRLGLLDGQIAYDLHLVRKIRNKFAHQTHGLHFESKELEELLRKSKLGKIKTYDGDPLFFDDLANSRNAFPSLCFFLRGHLAHLLGKTRSCKEKKIFPSLSGT
jgi:DNA-binding MltR family transcriptional regulator